MITHCISCNRVDEGQIEGIFEDGYKAYWCTDCYVARKPQIVCLCGSTRFFEEFAKTNLEETLNGNIVLSIGCDTHHVDSEYTAAEKRALDRLHKYKIRLADIIIVLNVGGYIGDSTSSEINFARRLGKEIIYKYAD